MAILKFLPHIILYKVIFYTFILMLTLHLYFLPCFLLKRVLHPMWPYGALFRTSKSQNMQTLGACRKEIPCKFGWWLFTALRYDHNLSHATKGVCKGICLTPKIRLTSLYCFHLVLHSHAIVSSPFLVVFYENKNHFIFIVSDFCLECEAGTQCPNQGMNDTMPCPAGFYCLNGTVNDGIACPIGKFVL